MKVMSYPRNEFNPYRVEVELVIEHDGDSEKEIHEPYYATEGSAGLDLHAKLDENIIINPGCSELIPTGLRMKIPVGFEGQIRSRSGLTLRHGIIVLNSPGTIDSDYRGPIGIILYNSSKTPFEISHNMRIAQMVISQCYKANLKIVSSFNEDDLKTERGEGGFGSTGTTELTESIESANYDIPVTPETPQIAKNKTMCHYCGVYYDSNTVCTECIREGICFECRREPFRISKDQIYLICSSCQLKKETLENSIGVWEERCFKCSTPTEIVIRDNEYTWIYCKKCNEYIRQFKIRGEEPPRSNYVKCSDCGNKHRYDTPCTYCVKRGRCFNCRVFAIKKFKDKISIWCIRCLGKSKSCVCCGEFECKKCENTWSLDYKCDSCNTMTHGYICNRHNFRCEECTDNYVPLTERKGMRCSACGSLKVGNNPCTCILGDLCSECQESKRFCYCDAPPKLLPRFKR